MTMNRKKNFNSAISALGNVLPNALGRALNSILDGALDNTLSSAPFGVLLSTLALVSIFGGTVLASSLEEDCKSELQRQQWPEDLRDKICKSNSGRAKAVLKAATEPCVNTAISLASTTAGMPKTLTALCFQDEMNGRSLKEINISCLKTYTAIISEDFLALDDLAKEQSNNYHSINNEIIKNCFKNISAATQASGADVKIIGRTTFHSLEVSILGHQETPTLSHHDGTAIPNVLLGGLSGITKVGKNNYVSVSDDRAFPRITYFSLQPQSDSGNRFRFQQTQTTLLSGNYLDLEDLQILSYDGDKVAQFIFTSEEMYTASGFASLMNKTSEAPPKSYIFITSPTGELQKSLKIPPIYYSRSIELDTLCGKKEDPGLFGFLAGLFNSGRKREQLAQLSPSDKAKCEQYEQNDGIRYNKGIESLALSEDKKHLYYTTEQAILFNGKLAADLHFTHHDLTNDTYDIYHYPYSPENGTGVVSLLWLDSKTLLTVERGFDSKQREAIVNVYQIKLPDSLDLKIEKKLVFNVKNLLAEMPPGLQAVDNFEGIAFGPKIDKDHFSIVMISDNNFSLKQKTDLLVISLPNEWRH